MIKGIIFDCWGTIFTNSQKPHPFAVFAKRLGHDISDRSFLKPFERNIMMGDGSVTGHIKTLLQELEIDPAPELVNELVGIILGSLPTQIIYEDTAKILDMLKKEYYLVLLSNTFNEGFTNLQAHYPIRDWFDLLLLSYRENTIKPDPVLYDKILRETGLTAAELLMVGDNYEDDVLAAEGAGIQAVLLDRRNRYPQVTENKIYNLNELVPLLRKRL